MNSRALIILTALGTLALAACSGSGGSTFVNPTPGPTCGPVGITSQLVYPAPGATAVPDATAQIVVAVSSPLPINTYNLALIAVSNGSSAQTANYLSQIAASQLPAGSASTTIVNPTYEAVNLIATLPAATQIQVALNIPNSTCTPLNVPGATFTTQ
ncbi:MAG TPA: hypothetical protein VNF68_02160 [Candidatus Baltobacteraceae bacterium]|nr:hypothetical protein [Candidatus Baltobacteraceae bacterium]